MRFVLEEVSGTTMVEIDRAFMSAIGVRPDWGGCSWSHDQLLMLGVDIGRFGRPGFGLPRGEGWLANLVGARIDVGLAGALVMMGERHRAERARSFRRLHQFRGSPTARTVNP